MNTTKNKPVIPLFDEDLEHVLEHTKHLWEEVRGKSIFITGGTGFFGMWLVESFLYINMRLSLNASICVLTRDVQAYQAKAPHLAFDPNLSVQEGDVRTFTFPEGRTFEYVIHAGTTSSAPVPPLEMFSTIVDGTRRVLEFAKVSGTKKFLFVSSGAVYGPQPEGMSHIGEDYLGGPPTTTPVSAYGEGKRAAELLCCMYSNESLECKIARCFAFVGPHLPLDAHFAIGNFIRDALLGRDISIHGNGKVVRSYLYASDLAIWLWQILIKGEADTPYNVGSKQAISISDLAKLVSAQINGELLITIQGDVDLMGKLVRYVPDITNSEFKLSLLQRVEIVDAIIRTAAWYRINLSGDFNDLNGSGTKASGLQEK